MCLDRNRLRPPETPFQEAQGSRQTAVVALRVDALSVLLEARGSGFSPDD